MKRINLVLSLAILASAVVYSSLSLSAQQAREDESPNQWLFKNLQEIQSIKVGTTRKEVDKLFTLPGGVQAMNPVTLVYRKSPYIFVRVSYKTERDSQGRVHWSPKDRVDSISQPYLQHWTVMN